MICTAIRNRLCPKRERPASPAGAGAGEVLVLVSHVRISLLCQWQSVSELGQCADTFIDVQVGCLQLCQREAIVQYGRVHGDRLMSLCIAIWYCTCV